MPNGAPPEGSQSPWLLAMDPLRPGVVFDASGPWMARSCGAIVQIADMLDNPAHRARAMMSAYSESRRDAPEAAEFEDRYESVRLAQRVLTARRLLAGVCGALSVPDGILTSMGGQPALSVIAGGAS